MTLSDFEDKSMFSFTPSFIKALANLPEAYDPSNANDMMDFRDFFSNWGQFFVVSSK